MSGTSGVIIAILLTVFGTCLPMPVHSKLEPPPTRLSLILHNVHILTDYYRDKLLEGRVDKSFSLELPNNTTEYACAFTEYLKNVTRHQMNLQEKTNITVALNWTVGQLTHEFGIVACNYTPTIEVNDLHVFKQKTHGFQVLSCLGEWIESFLNIRRTSTSCVRQTTLLSN